ncbi:uncharacterized protein [Oryza sativa Japonica Group]|uniref:uncharacterized protein n=1 Tax=Oryza sativa subsp. japonica TaxID=39947 RepID=UPI00339BB8EE
MRPPASVSAAAGRRSPRRLPPPSPLAVPASVSTAAGRESCGSAAAGASRARWGRAAQHPEQPPATWIEAEEAPARESSDESSSSSFSGSRRAEAGFATVRGALVIGEAPQLRLLFSEIFKTEQCFNPFANKKKKRCRKQLTWGIPWIMLDLISSTGDKYNEEEPNAFDLFKEFHYSKKKKLLHHCCIGGYYSNGKQAVYKFDEEDSI